MNDTRLDELAKKLAPLILREIQTLNQSQSYSDRQMLTAQEAATFLNVSISTVYKYSHGRVIPHYKPQGREIYFKRCDLDNYVESRRIASQDELEAQADDYLVSG